MADINITNIQGYSIHDGPGIRTVVFFKGCPMRCKWCANPENLQAFPEVGFLVKLCQNCGRCAKACPVGAIVPGEGVYRIDREKCTNCGECVESCFYGALVNYGKAMSPEEVFQKVRRDKMFYDTSGGGVTVSGGEPMIYADFVAELFEKCRAEGINTCVETCGYAPEEGFEIVVPLTDWFYFDLKIMDEESHRYWTGCSNDLILKNARRAAEMGAKILFRQPLIPGVNNTDENIEKTSEFILSLGRDDIALQIMPYHRAGQTKYDALNKLNETAGIVPMEADEITAVMEKYIALGVNCSISK